MTRAELVTYLTLYPEQSQLIVGAGGVRIIYHYSKKYIKYMRVIAKPL